MTPNNRRAHAPATFRDEYEAAAAGVEQLRRDFARLAERFHRLMPQLTSTTVLHRWLPLDARRTRHALKTQLEVDALKASLEQLAEHLAALAKSARDTEAQSLADALRQGRTPGGLH